MIITISGQLGAGKSSVAKLVARKLRFRHLSTGDLWRKMAVEKGFSVLELNKLAEKKKGEIDKEIDERTRKLGQDKDNFVMDSRLAYHFIPKSIKVFLDVDVDVAAERIFKDKKRKSEKGNINLEETKKKIRQRQNSERKRYREYYGTDYLDFSNYDLLIDTTNLSIEEVAEKIVAYVKKPGNKKH